MLIKNLFDHDPFSFDKSEKEEWLDNCLKKLTIHHYANCLEYKKMMNVLNFKTSNINCYKDIPFLPVRLFKVHNLKSVSSENIIRKMTSSGTSGQAVSKIFLDKLNASNQTKALTKIVTSLIGSKRMPMLIIDSKEVLNEKRFSARAAGITGFSIFSIKRHFALDSEMKIDIDSILNFIDEYKDRKIFIFGFTFMIYEYFINQLKKLKLKLNLNNSILIHGGGWKKMIDRSISNDDFKSMLNVFCGCSSVHDYYGMIEQTGSIYLECEKGNLHTSIFSDVIVRRSEDFSEAKIGEKGLIQTISVLPTSYPGHSLLTDDEGVLLGVDNCECGRLGKYFKITGRIKNAEIRGCSDTQ